MVGDRSASRMLTRIVIWWSSFTDGDGRRLQPDDSGWHPVPLWCRGSGAWPNAAKAISRWFPTAERGTAQGIFFMGAHLGGGLDPLLVTRF